MKRRSYFLLAALLGTLASGAQAAPPAEIPADLSAILPPRQTVQQTLENLPALRTARLQQDMAAASRQKLESGSHEWVLRTGQTRRTEATGQSLKDQEIALERPVRWFGKAGKDAAIGEKQVSLAQLAYADTWHEAGRTLLSDWFDTLRASVYRQKLEEQLELSRQLRQLTEKRVRAGDAAQIELVQADTELQRLAAQWQQAQMREEQQMQLFSASYPGLQPVPLQTLPAPLPAGLSQNAWIDLIMDDNHELELAEEEAALSRMQASRIASDAMPDPTIGIRVSRERDGQERLLGISISIPLSGSGRTADSSMAQVRARISAEKHSLTRMKVLRDAQRVTREAGHLYTIWQSQQQVQQQSQAQAATMMRAYQLGEAAFSDTLQTRRMALESSLTAATAQLDALQAHARLELDAHRLWTVD
ncbi:TolC family protein [Undibacterium griseum]|uniref:TolC family protein n=1 Tax=Undibacterium griseum TaxID=2762295 RepID=A0ABR6YPN1_9BURK|nr:TolC family protein [Undibacterium griseum]MBC3885855.1 TolC family protein [Undibacterium griseum]